MPYVQIEGLKIYFVEKGSGPDSLLLVYGNVSSTEYWDKFLDILPPRYRAVALDLRGCGQTEHPPGGYNVPQFVEDLSQFTERLGLTRFHLLGHSMEGHPEKIKEFIEISLRYYQPLDAFERQFAACLRHDTVHRLNHITMPTLIRSGDDDPLVPPENSRILKELIPHAELNFFSGCRHCFFIEKGEEFNQNVTLFLKSVKGE